MAGELARESRADRTERGRAARKAVPLASLGELHAAADQDPVTLLEQQSVGRVPDLIPVRYGRMLLSPFTFYRGAALLMAADLANGPRSGLTAQLCGDAHLSNFGLFASPERRLVFDVNDFDETNPGPFEWDVKRLATSLEIAGRDNGHTIKQRRRAVLATVRAYRMTIREFAAQGNMAVWYAHQAVDPGTPGLQAVRSKKSRRSLRDSVDRAYARDNIAAQRKLTERVDGRLRILHDPPVVVPAREFDTKGLGLDLDEWMEGLLDHYVGTLQPDRRHLIEQYRVVDVAHKVVGVGSVGARAWIILLLGADDQDPLFLQAKEAQASVLEAYTASSRYRNHGRRVVEGQRLIQAYGDILLGWHTTKFAQVPADYYVRQLRDWKGAVEVADLDPEALGLYGEFCARTLARAHARSGDRVAIGAYLGSKDAFDQALADFASLYADKNELDYGEMERARETGRIPVLAGV
jgi:uncharacterized protein (DUF2252 family)